eukprot:scaffold4055_cov51-Phaeocystis_antarctica.AAC.1
MVHTIQGPSSGSWQVAIPSMQSVRAMAVRANLQAKPRPCEPLIRTRRRKTKGTMYFPCRNDAHVAAGVIMKLTMSTAKLSVVRTAQTQEPIH